MLDLHIHDAHFARLLFGMPRSVRATGTLRDGVPELWTWRFFYPDRSLRVSGSCGVRDGGWWTFNHAYKIALRTRELRFDFAVSNGRGHYLDEVQICDLEGRCRPANLKGGDPFDAFTAELHEALRSVRTRKMSTVLCPATACDAVRICQAEAKSILRGRAVRL
jgi:predicted dehydrogenase